MSLCQNGGRDERSVEGRGTGEVWPGGKTCNARPGGFLLRQFELPYPSFDGAVRASLGCGNPTALADLRSGGAAVDLGFGGGIDVVISNCVINLSGDNDRVLAETFRVLKPVGRFAVSDLVVRGEVPPLVRKNMELRVGCVAGALEESDYRGKLERAGFVNVSIEAARVYDRLEGKFISAFIRATKA